MSNEIFDVKAALKEYPEAEVAAHLAKIHGVDRGAYLKEGLTDSEFLSEYGAKSLPAAATPPSSHNDPITGAVIGGVAGGAAEAAKYGIDLSNTLNKIARGANIPEGSGESAGQKYAAKTGYGAGEGETVREVVEEQKRREAPIGKGKVASKIKGPLGIDPAMEAIARDEAEAQRFAKIRAAERIAREAEAKYATPNKVGKSLPVAGATLGYNVMDIANQAGQGDPLQAGIAATGAVGSVAPFIKRLPPKLRALGFGASLLAPTINRTIDVVEEKAQGGLVGLAAGGKLGKAAELAAKFVPKPTKILKASEALGPHEGKWLNVTQSDRMRSTGGDLGGPGFSKFQLERPEYQQAEAAWGVGQKPTASGIINVNKRFPEGQAIWTPMIGSETQHHSNQHVYDALTNEFNRQARLGNLTPELQARINTRLANAPATKGIFPAEFDIANPEHLSQYGDTFNRRGALSTVMSGEGVGGTKGRIIDYPGIMQEMTDPMTIGAPTHSLGTRLFTLNNEIEHRPDLHSAFPYILKGQDQGVAFAPVPKELGIQDFINQFKDFKGREPGYYDLVRTTPSQQITEKYLRSLEAAGHADGGSINSADLPNVNLDVRNIPNMTGMPGVGYMQTPQGSMARLQMEKELENARLRAGVSGLAMALPGQHGVKMMPGQMDVGASIPIGRGNLDISANRSINPIPGRGHMQGANVRYTLPFKKGGLA